MIGAGMGLSSGFGFLVNGMRNVPFDMLEFFVFSPRLNMKFERI